MGPQVHGGPTTRLPFPRDSRCRGLISAQPFVASTFQKALCCGSSESSCVSHRVVMACMPMSRSLTSGPIWVASRGSRQEEGGLLPSRAQHQALGPLEAVRELCLRRACQHRHKVGGCHPGTPGRKEVEEHWGKLIWYLSSQIPVGHHFSYRTEVPCSHAAGWRIPSM